MAVEATVVGFSEVGVTGGCELPCVGTGSCS